MTCRSLLAGLLLLPALTLVGCDSAEPADDAPASGLFNAAVAGGQTVALDGAARFEVVRDSGQTVTALGFIDADDPRDVFFLAVEGAPRAGSFTIGDDEAGGLLVLSGADDGTLYATTGGTVTVTRTSGSRVEGRFRVEATNLVDPDDEVVVEGTFHATPGDVAEPEATAATPR